MNLCVNTSSPIFKETAKRLNISESQLELIAHKYINAIQNADAFPSDAYIESMYSGTPMQEATASQKIVWRESFATPRLFSTMDEAREYMDVVSDFLSPESIGLKTRNDGLIEVRVAKPQGTKVLYDVYQGRKTERSDGRPYNYYTTSQREASDYGSFVERRVVDVDKFLVKLNSDGTDWSIEYTAAFKEFEKVYGKAFDILDSSEEGLKTQEAFFEFLKGKGYKGLDLVTNNPTAFKEGEQENAYIVTFDDSTAYDNDNVPEQTDDFLFHKGKVSPSTAERRANLNIVRRYYSRPIMERASQIVALAQAYYDRISTLEFDVNDPDFGAAELKKFREVEAIIQNNKDLFPSYGSFYLRNGKLKISFAPVTLDTQIAKEFEMFDSWSDASLMAEAQRIQLEQEAEGADDFELYINPKKRPQIEVAIQKKNPFIGEHAIREALEFLHELENTPDNNQFVDCCIRWIKNGTISIPRDSEKVRKIFELARKAGIDTASFKTPFDLQIAIVKEEKVTDGQYINPDKYAALRFNRSETVEGRLVQVYDVEDSEAGRQAVCQILADASPKDGNGRALVNSPWCLSTFNYDPITKRATPTESSGRMWEHYSKGKRQIAIMDGKPVAFNSSSENRNQWWNFYDVPNISLTSDHLFGTENRESVTDKIYKDAKRNPDGMEKYYRFGSAEAYVSGKNVNSMHITSPTGEVNAYEITLNDNGFFGFTRYGYGFDYHTNTGLVDSHNSSWGVLNTFELDVPEISMEKTLRFHIDDTYIEDNFSKGAKVTPFFSILQQRWDKKLPHYLVVPYSEELVAKIMEKKNAVRSLFSKMQNDLGIDFNALEISKVNPVTIRQRYFEDLEKVSKELYDAYEELHTQVKKDAIAAWTPYIEKFTKEYNETRAKEEEKRMAELESQVNEMAALRSQLNAIRRENNIAEPTGQRTPTSRRRASVNEYTTEAQENEYSREEAAEFGDDALEREYYASDDFEDIYNEIAKKHKKFSFKDLIRAIKFLQEKDYSKLFDEGTKKEVNEKLSKALFDILRKYNFDIVEGDLSRAFGDDVKGAFDVLQKIVYLAEKKDRNAVVDAEEFSHAFIKMMGAVWHRPENRKKYAETRVFSELADAVQNTSFYREVVDLYSDDPNYQYHNGRLNRRKLQEEALGKALAATLVERAEIRDAADKSFLARLKKWFNDVLVWFKSKITDYGKFERELNQIADSILTDTYADKYLNKVKDSGYTLQDYATTIRDASNKDGGLALNIMRSATDMGGLITGSISYRAQGTVYRKSADSLHDIDTVWPSNVTNLFSENPWLFRYNVSQEAVEEAVRNNSVFREYFNKLQELGPTDIIAAYPARSPKGTNVIVNLIMCEDENLRERFKNLSGNFNYRLEQFTEAEREQIHLIDMFMNSWSSTKEYNDTEFGLTLADYTESFREKLAISRPKDLYDYQRFAPNHRTYADVERQQRDVMLSKSKKDNARANIDVPDKAYIKESVLINNKTISGEELQTVVSAIEQLQADTSLVNTITIPYREWKSLNIPINYGDTKTLAGFVGILDTEYGEGKIRYNSNNRTQTVPRYWYEIMKVLKEHEQMFKVLVRAFDKFDEEPLTFDFDDENGILSEFLYEPKRVLDALDSYGLINYKYSDSRQGELFTPDTEGNLIPNVESNITITDDRGYSYTRINAEFKNNLLGHLRQEKSGFYNINKTRNALVDMANALFDFFDREGFKIVITNNPFDSNRGSTVESFGKYVTIFYQESAGQGNKYLNILHELLHIATNQAISFESMGTSINSETLTAYYDMFVAKLQEDPEYVRYSQIMPTVSSYEEMDKKVPLKYQILYHAASKPGEFISCCISNKEVQEVLESISYVDIETSEQGTLFDQVKRWFKNVLSEIFRGTSLTTRDFLEDLTSFLLDVNYSNDRIANMDAATAKEMEEFYEKRWGNAKDFVSPVKQAIPASNEKPKVDQVYQNKIQKIVAQINNLLNSNIPVNEVRDEANKAMDWISDQLTQYLENPEIVWNKYYRDREDPSRKEEIVKRVSSLSRQELVEMLGVDKMLKFYAEEVLKLNSNNEEAYLDFTPEEVQKYQNLIPENLNALVQLGYSRFLDREGFGLVFSDNDDTMYQTQNGKSVEDIIPVDDFNGENNVDNNYEEDGNQQEHWQIESRTREILASASALVRNVISSLYYLVDTGNKNDDGSPVYDNKKDKIGRNERVTAVTAVRSIVKWTQGAASLSDMVRILSTKVEENPWVSQLITKLSDTTGKESDFQSQFFTTFYRHFQPYTIVTIDDNGRYYSRPVNEHPALDDAIKTIKTEYKLGRLPLFNSNGVDARNLELFRSIKDTLDGEGKLTNENRQRVVELVGRLLKAVGFPQPEDAIDRVLTNGVKNNILEKSESIYNALKSAIGDKAYDPFKYGEKSNGITGFLRGMLQPFTNALEDVMVSSVYDSGKMYQSFVTPSWTTKLFSNMHLNDEQFEEFLLDEFGQSEWFVRDTDFTKGLTSEEVSQMSDIELKKYKARYLREHASELFKNVWLAKIAGMSAADRQEAFTHRVQLNFDKSNYMRGMNDLQYILSVYTEFFSEASNKHNKGTKFAFYRFPMLSNKPSNEFVKMVRFTGMNMESSILDGFMEVFWQELGRIQTVRMMNLKKGDLGFKANFDEERGRQFVFLDYLNEYLNDTTSTIGELLERKLSGDKNRALSESEEAYLIQEVRNKIKNYLNDRVEQTKVEYEKNGVLSALTKVSGITNVDSAIKEFVWNDTFAESQLLELLIVDKAYYANEEDVQKRLAQVHSPGIRGNWEALDYGVEETDKVAGRPPQRVSDGKVRAVKLADYDSFISDTLDNLMEVFDRKIEEAPENEKDAWRDLKETVRDAYSNINVVDGQAFVSPSAYRKHAIAFGEWSEDAEKVYNELKEGRYNLSSLKSVFNPRKPFTYGKVIKHTTNPALNTPIKTFSYGVQYKNSEYLLIMANAMLAGQHTEKPNILGAIFDVLEESYKTDPKEGLDFVIFESGVKTGLTGAISLNGLVDLKDGRVLAKKKLETFIYEGGVVGNRYNENYVDVLDAMDYVNQQPVPEHFMDHGGLQWGSQVRAIMPSDLETTFMGKPVTYSYVDDATGRVVTADKEKIRREWEETTARLVNDSVDRLKEELGLEDNTLTQKDRNVILSKILQREILNNSRYGVDLLLACSVDDDGNFRIPLGDPIQSKRIEQLISSIIKNRVNKQKVEGGTLVEVTNFGMSRRLEIRYYDRNSKNGALLKKKSEYLAEGHTEEEFKEYLNKNQGGIAYHECYAPAWAREIFQNFADEFGNIDIEAIEMIDPDLLLMFGYRIPTEDKYSTAPYKIVGFLPKEAGDGFMQPWDVTAIDGSDFDVDKKNLMRMVINLKSKLLSKKQFAARNNLIDEDIINKRYSEYRKENGPTVDNLAEKVAESLPNALSKEDEELIKRDAERKREEGLRKARTTRDRKNENALDTYNRKYESQVVPLENRYNELNAKEDLTSKEEDEMKRLDKKTDRMVKKLEREQAEAERKNEEEYNNAVEIVNAEVEDYINTSRSALIKDRNLEAIREILREGIFRNSESVLPKERALFKAVKKAYLDMVVEASKPRSGRDYLNNKIFRMQWAIATHESTADKMLNPGNFDIQKRVGYVAEAFRHGAGDWDTLWNMDIKSLKKLIQTQKNLMDFLTQTQFYKQNSVASQILGIFAVSRSAHAMFEGRGYYVDVGDKPFVIAGMTFGNYMEIDPMHDRTGATLVGKALGSLVGASADAVKDPVLNFMNINKETVNVLTAALRLGMDFESIALLLSSSKISEALVTYNKTNLTKKVSFDKIIKKMLRDMLRDNSNLKVLEEQELTREEMISGIKEASEEVAYKTLYAFSRLSSIANTIQPTTDVSRLNSVKSAVGPQYINTLASDRKFTQDMDDLYSVSGKVYIDTSTSEELELGDSFGGVILSERNVDMFVKAGALKERNKYTPLTLSKIFEDLPSLEAFYEGYKIAKKYFKEMGILTASDEFQKVVNALADEDSPISDLEFKIWNTPKLLSSLADFFQSYVMMASGTVKPTMLKYYTEQFAKDFVTNNYKNKYANNAFISAIKPTMVTKEGQPDKLILTIDTTGMEQSEKDALSAGWIQLEKDDPTLSHRLFYYNFFRGGIGFSPKTFMGLIPLQVKERIPGYIDTLRRLPQISGASVLEQWVRNNWTNSSLVSSVSGVFPSNDGLLRLKNKKYADAYRAPFIRIHTADGDFLFKKIRDSKGTRTATYAPITPLGNNREYLEIYPDSKGTAKPGIQTTNRALPEVVDSEMLEVQVDDYNDVMPTVEEETEALQEFVDDILGESPEYETNIDRLTRNFNEAIKDLDLESDDAKFEEELNKFCK